MGPLDQRELGRPRVNLDSNRVERKRPAADAGKRLSGWRRTGERPFDQRPARDATVDELDLDYAQAYSLPQAVAEDIPDDNQRLLDQQLRSLRLLVGDAPIWGALLGLGRDPQGWLYGAHVQFLRIDGPDVTDPIRRQRVLTGRIEAQCLGAHRDRNRIPRTTIAGLSGGGAPAARPQRGHASQRRGLERAGPGLWYSDRLEIRSPGGLFGRITPDNFGSGVADHRKPLVAEIMHHLGFAQGFGSGIPLARKALRRNGNPEPEVDFRPTHVIVTVRAAP